MKLKELLKCFDALSEHDKHKAAEEILRRFAGSVDGDLPEDALVEAADELFGPLDEEEAGNTQR